MENRYEHRPARDAVRRHKHDRGDMSTTMDRASWEEFEMNIAQLPPAHVAKLATLAPFLDGVVTRAEVNGMPVDQWMALITSRRAA